MREVSAARTRVIAVGNQKGGVGKTTNTIQLAGALSELGRKSLIIDLDMTCGATKSLGAPTEGWNSTFELLTGTEDPENTIIDEREVEVPLPPGIHLIPSSRKLAELDNFLATHPFLVAQDLLLQPLNQLRGRYDYIFLDTPPQITKTTVPALKAADYVILAAMPDHLAISGLGDALKDISTAQRFGNARLTLLGVVICAMRRPVTRLARELVDYVDRVCVDGAGNPLKFDTEVSQTVVLQEAQKKRTTIFQYEPSHPVAEQYRALAREVEGRIRALEGQPPGAVGEVAANA